MNNENKIKAYVRKTGKLVEVVKVDEKNNVYMDSENNPYFESELDFHVVHIEDVKTWKDEPNGMSDFKEMFKLYMAHKERSIDKDLLQERKMHLVRIYLERGIDDLDFIFGKVDKIIRYVYGN
ncbi:MAG: hypothetical protein II431_02615 [Prevotella sp.]|nr:hypothetical protein [Prevotella sp.]